MELKPGGRLSERGSNVSWVRAPSPAAASPDLRHRQGRRRQDRPSPARSGSPRRGRGMRTIVAELTGEVPSRARLRVPGQSRPLKSSSSPRRCARSRSSPEQAMEEYLRVKAPAGSGICSVRAACSRPSRWRRRGCASCSTRQGLGAGPAAPPHPGRRAIRPRDRRRSRDRARRRASCGPRARSPRSLGSGRSPTRLTRSRTRSPTATSPAILAVCTPEEMPVNETVSLHEALLRERP